MSDDSLDGAQPVVDVVLRLFGDELDPAFVSTTLGVEASETRIKGEKRRLSSGSVVTSETGMWKLCAPFVSTSVSERLSWVQEKLSLFGARLSTIPGVEEVRVSIFIALGRGDDGAVTYEDILTPDQVHWLGSIGAAISIVATYSED